MAQRTRTQYKALYGTSGTLFPDNTTGEISEADVRAFGEDGADSVLFKSDDMIDEDNMSSNLDTKVPTQQSVKAYADGKVGNGVNVGVTAIAPSQNAVIDYVAQEIAAASLGIVTSWKTPVAIASTANLTLSGEQTIDGVLSSASRILVKDQSTGSQNGIYVTGAGAWTRATDMDVTAEFNGAAVTVLGGTANANTTWIQTADNVTVGSTSIVWAQLGTSVPDANASTKGIAKLYAGTGPNTDGSIDQATITGLIGNKLQFALVQSLRNLYNY